jgi:dihydrofolate reductase
MQVSLDGFVGGPNGELDWMESNWDQDLNNHVAKLTEPVDTILLGRKLAEGFIPYWSAAALNPENPERDAGKIMTSTPKIVFSKTMQDSPWPNTVIAKRNITDEVNHLKKQKGGDIIVYGGANLVSNLVKLNLIDEYHLLINPVAIGNGLTIFRTLENRLALKLVNSKSFPCGIVVLHYQPK